MLRIISLFFLLLPLGLIAKDPYPVQSGVDIIKYHFTIKLDTSSNEIVAEAEILARMTNGVSHLYLDLIKMTGEGGMQVDSINVGPAPVNFNHEQDRLMIPTPSFQGSDSLLSFHIYYHGNPRDGLIISRNKFGRPSFFGDNWPDRARHWLPVIDHPSDKALVDFTVIADQDLEVVANGFLFERTMTTNGQLASTYRSDVPLPTKVMVIGVSQFAIQTTGFADQIPVQTWVYEENKEAGFTDYSPAVDITQYFSQKIGPYAFEKLANVQSKTVYGGMENSGAIFYYENSVTGKNRLHSLLAHEIAHQWFGDAVTEADWHHIWLSEGFATYLEAVCMAEYFQLQPLSDQMNRMRGRVVNYYKRSPQPLVDTSVKQLIRLLNTNSYQKGAWVLHMLRNELGDASFWKGIQQYYIQYKNKTALTDDFRRAMEEASQKNLEAFFNQWVYRAGHPILSVNQLEDNDQPMLQITQHQAGSAFIFPLTLEFTNPDGGLSRKHVIISKKQERVSFSNQTVFENLRIDPDNHLLFELRSN